MLLCTVRDCHQPLVREERRLVCPQKHSFDIARSGYVNLLQPQDSRSKNPGDTVEAVAARRRLHDRGITRPLLRAIAETLKPAPTDVILDAGCGDGFYLGTLAQGLAFDAHGVDISIPAVNLAAVKFPQCEWIVANADRFVPYADKTFSTIMSITARMNAAEFHRVLKDNGRLLIAIPAPDDFIELRGTGRDRVERTIETFAPHFKLQMKSRATTVAELDADAADDVLHAIYRPLRAEPVMATKVTLSMDLLLFEKADIQ